MLSDGALAAVARSDPARPTRPRVFLRRGDEVEVVDLAADGAPEVDRVLGTPAGAGDLGAFLFG